MRVFSATTLSQRKLLADRINLWLRQRPREIVGKAVRQSSDLGFHCLTLVFFFRERPE